MVLRRDDALAEKSRENLQKVTHASDHLLTMINDLLDLSKIEAGRMDVNPEQFDVKALAYGRPKGMGSPLSGAATARRRHLLQE